MKQLFAKHKNLRFLLLALLATGLLGFALYIKASQSHTSLGDFVRGKKSTSTSDNQANDMPGSEPASQHNAPSDKPAPPPPSEKPQLSQNDQPPDAPMSVSITTAEQSDQTIILDALVNGATTGTCTATFEKSGSATVTKTSPLIKLTAYYCQEFQVARTEFGSAGEWTARVKLTSGSREATSEARRFSIQ